MPASGELGTASAVVVEVPVAEPVVGRHRARLDSAAAWGVPAHVTLLFPFVPPAQIDGDVRARLARVIAAVPRFEARWPRTGWFPDRVLYLVPEPDAAWRTLIEAVITAFPGHPPYGGVYAENTPHLTIGETDDLAALRSAEAQVCDGLPFTMPITQASLICGSQQQDSFRTVATFELGPAAGGPLRTAGR